MSYTATEYVRIKGKSVKPSMRFTPDKDFNEWRKEASTKLEELLGLPLEKCEPEIRFTGKSEGEGYTRLDFDFQSESEYWVHSSFLIPSGEKKKRPCVICLQGHSSGKHISLGESKFPGDEKILAGRDFALQAVSAGYCAVAIDQRYMGEAGQGQSGASHCLQGLANTGLLFGRTPIGERVWDVMALIDLLKKEFSEFIDFDNLICLGNSGGGTTTLFAAALEERIKIAVPSCYLCTYEQSIMAMYHCACNFVPHIYKYFDMGDVACLIAPRKLLVVSGEKDDIFPIDGAKKSFSIVKGVYEFLGKGDLCEMVIGKGGHQFYPVEAYPVIRKFVDEN